MTKARDLSQTPNASLGFKNRIINGNMLFDQRNGGSSITPTVAAVYTVDRWFTSITQASKFSIQQNAGSVTPPTGFTNYLGVTSLSAYSVGSGDTFLIQQSIEGYNVADLAWGTANAQPVTLSFLVRSSLTGTFGGALVNGAANRSYPFSYTISAANTWEQKSITIAGDTTGTWLTNNGLGIGVRFGIGSGSTFSGTAGAWAAGNIVQPTGSVSVVGTNGATFYITGVQLEKGSTATSFDVLDYVTQLQQCQRYYQSVNTALTFGQGSSSIMLQWNPPVVMRTAPTGSLTTTSPYWENVVFGSLGSFTNAAINVSHLQFDGGDILLSGTLSPTTSYGAMSKLGGGVIRLSAEL
jgi:hypothetical protein